MGTVLTQEQIARYRHDGYLYPLPALSAEELAACNAGLARYESWLGGPVNQADRRWRSASYVMLPWVDALTRHPRVLDVVEDVIGPDILVYTATFFIKEARSPTFADAVVEVIGPGRSAARWRTSVTLPRMPSSCSRSSAGALTIRALSICMA